MKNALKCCAAVLCLFFLLGCSNDDPEPSDNRTVITMATWLPTTIQEIVDNFNASQKDIYIELQTNYTPLKNDGDSYNQASIDRMHADMLVNQPDLYYSVSMDAAKLRNAGLIADWYPVMAADETFDSSEYQTHIWNLLETDGKLYQLAASFDIFGIGGPAELYGDLGGFTIDAFETFLREHTDQLYIEQDRMLQIMLWYGTHMDFIDRETWTCDFETTDFLEILQFLNALPAVPQLGMEVNVARVSGAADHYNNYRKNAYYTRVIGSPSRYSSGPAVAIGDTFALSSTTEHLDACWTFIKWMLSQEIQSELYMGGYGIPIRTDVWEESLDRAQLGGEDERSLFYGYTVGDAKFMDGELLATYVEGLSKTEADYLRQLVEHVDRAAEGYFDYEDITAIVEEEVLSYLSGDKTAEECTHLIQERVNILLAEMQ